MTVREQIMETLITTLNTGRPVDVPVAERLRFLSIDSDQLPVMVVAPIREETARVAAGFAPLAQRRLVVAVRLYVKGATGPAPLAVDALAEPMLAWIVKQLVGMRVPNLIVDIEESETAWEFVESDSPMARVTLELVVSYQTRLNDLEQWA